jgi:uncharacterized damage-inducible protein DinB
MPIADALLPEYDHEMATTRRLLDRVRDQELGWRPHEKSMTLGQLSGHLANLPMWCSAVLDMSAFDLDSAGEEVRPKAPVSREALLKEFDAKTARARADLARRTDPELMAPWTLKRGDHEIFTMPRVSAMRFFVMNHSIHHRGQLSVYLRLLDIPVPSIYGPTADEQ